MDGSLPQPVQASSQTFLRALASLLEEALEILERQGLVVFTQSPAPSAADLRALTEYALSIAMRTLTAAGDPGGGDVVPPAPRPEADPVGFPFPRQHTTAQAVHARRQLFDAFVGEAALPSGVLEDLAVSAGWPALPQRIQPVALAPGAAVPCLPSSQHLLVGTAAQEPCLLLLDPTPQKYAALRAALGTHTAAVGMTVGIAEAGASLRWARRLVHFHVARQGQLGGPLCVEDHLSTLMLLQDEVLSQAHSAHWLRPLTTLPAQRGERLGDTLQAWLDGGGATQAAKLLGVHPQTIRYRLRQIDKLFGPQLRDPRSRLELKLALRSRTLMTARPTRALDRAARTT
ncbi:PucR family transcriptional regulator [Streptomyces melanogenes]|uniref:PucR family transcriptional regulator n=1 Tax=Streptomyces melanogenes TaxID=67326 RepID=UPI00167DDB77|nr:helix-turn-helix domain-containing protein [Streptomyces melanogenes]GGP85755.1 hypothetical protein GCM10010278_75230 [Streptomyces melanogenes]